MVVEVEEQKVNLGEKYETDLYDSFKKFGDHGGKYPNHVTEILKSHMSCKICGTCFKSAKHAGGANTRRPMGYRSGSGGFYISAEGKDEKILEAH